MIRDTDWQGLASCRAETVDPEWFHPTAAPGSPAYARQSALARSVCAGCPVRSECLADALARPDGWAILGGLDPVERDVLTRRPAA